MPTLKYPNKLKIAYDAATKIIRERKITTVPLAADQRLYRLIDPTRPYSRLSEPKPGGFVSKEEGFQLMIPADGDDTLPNFQYINKNRFSGLSGNSMIPAAAGLYLSMQQHALMNEVMYYANYHPHEPSALQIEYTSGKAATMSNGPLAGKCILQFRVLGSMLLADLSPHNIFSKGFFDAIGKDTWKEVQDPDDCSVARGIGLAIANSGYLSGLIARTVRGADQEGKCGDNVLLFTRPGRQIEHISLEKAIFFDKTDGYQSFPSAFTKKPG